jgi:hypothetical protein
MRKCSLFVLLTCLAFGTGTRPALAEVKGYKITTDKTVDPGSLETIVRQAIERASARTNDEKAIALYEYLHNTIFHWAYPTEAAPQSVGPLKVINVYGWGLCGGQHTVLKALFESAGWECRYVGWSNPGHTTIEVKYDGKWHYFDVFLKCYYWSKGKGHIVSQEEIAADPSLVLDAVKEGRAARQNLCCGDAPEGVVSGCRSRRVVGDSKGWGSVTWRDENYSPLLRLPAAASLRLDWKGEPGRLAVDGQPPAHSCGLRDLRSDRVLGPIAEHYGPRNWSNGRLVYAPDFSRATDLADVELQGARARAGKLAATDGQGRALFKLPLPYAYVGAKVEAGFEGGEGNLFVSADAGMNWQRAAGGDISPLVKQKYDVWLKVEFPAGLTGLRVEAVVEHNRGALPYLVPGRNQVTVSLDQSELPKDCVLGVTYAYQEATVPDPQKRARFDGTGVTYGPVMQVTREITSAPFTFAIDVGGNLPPKMIALERSIRAK